MAERHQHGPTVHLWMPRTGAHLGVHRGGGARMGYLQEDEYGEASDFDFLPNGLSVSLCLLHSDVE